MKVKELIVLLLEFDANKEIVTAGDCTRTEILKSDVKEEDNKVMIRAL